KMRIDGGTALLPTPTYINFFNATSTGTDGGVYVGQNAGTANFEIMQTENADIEFYTNTLAVIPPATPDPRMIIHSDGRVTVNVPPVFTASQFVVRGSGGSLTGVFDVQSSAATPA